LTLTTAKNPDGFFSWLIPAGFATNMISRYTIRFSG